MKILKMVVMTLCLAFLASCGGNSGYNAEECKHLVELTKDNGTLSEKDTDSMISQMEAIINNLIQLKKDKGSEGATQAIKENTEIQEQMGYLMGMAMYIQKHASDLTPDQMQKFVKIGSQMKELDED